MDARTAVSPSLDLYARTDGGVTIAELSGELDIASAQALREQLLRLLRPGSARLVVGLSNVTFCDASGLAVLVSTGRRARLLGGFLHLAAVSPQAGRAMQVSGLLRNFAIFPTAQAAAAQPRPAPNHKAAAAAARVPVARALAAPARRHTGPSLSRPEAGELRGAVAALLAHADAWHAADPGRRFTSALRAMARAVEGTDDTAMDTAARSLLSALARHPLTHSPAVATTATRLRRVLNPESQPATI